MSEGAAPLKRSDLFILEEVGYLAFESADASLLFEVVSERYELRKSIILTRQQELWPVGRDLPGHRAPADVMADPWTPLNQHYADLFGPEAASMGPPAS